MLQTTPKRNGSTGKAGTADAPNIELRAVVGRITNAERRDECPLSQCVAGDQAIAAEIECFIDGIVGRFVQVLHADLAIQDSIRIAAMCAQMLREKRRRPI